VDRVAVYSQQRFCLFSLPEFAEILLSLPAPAPMSLTQCLNCRSFRAPVAAVFARVLYSWQASRVGVMAGSAADTGKSLRGHGSIAEMSSAQRPRL